MGKEWGSCGLGILLGGLLIACVSDQFWLGLDRGMIQAALIMLKYLVLLSGAAAVLGAVFWGCNRAFGSPRPFSHCLWGATIVVIGMCALILFLKQFYSVI